METKPWETYEPYKDTHRYGNIKKFKHCDLGPGDAIHLRCLDCVGGTEGGSTRVDGCECGANGSQPACPLWPFRLGYRKRQSSSSRVKAIRNFCLSCMNETPNEEGRQHFIRECGDRTCPLLQFRFGTVPSRKGTRKIPEALQKLNESRRKAKESRA